MRFGGRFIMRPRRIIQEVGYLWAVAKESAP